MSILFTLLLPDLIFVLSAVAFNLLIAGIFIAQKHGRTQVVRRLGIAMLALGFPLVYVFIQYLTAAKAAWILIYFVFIFLYLVVELLLDYILKYDFRSRKITHIPYIILEYVALFGFIGIAFDIHRTWGFIVTITFWILLGCLIYLYAGRRKETAP